MTWTCPLCGYENMKDPLNSRHKPKCGCCNEDIKTVVEVQDQINEQRADNQEIIQSERNRLNRAKEEIEQLKTELSTVQEAFDNSAKIISEARKELNRLDNIRIFRDIDRETKAQSDEKQKKIIEATKCAKCASCGATLIAPEDGYPYWCTKCSYEMDQIGQKQRQNMR